MRSGKNINMGVLTAIIMVTMILFLSSFAMSSRGESSLESAGMVFDDPSSIEGIDGMLMINSSVDKNTSLDFVYRGGHGTLFSLAFSGVLNYTIDEDNFSLYNGTWIGIFFVENGKLFLDEQLIEVSEYSFVESGLPGGGNGRPPPFLVDRYSHIIEESSSFLDMGVISPGDVFAMKTKAFYNESFEDIQIELFFKNGVNPQIEILPGNESVTFNYTRWDMYIGGFSGNRHNKGVIMVDNLSYHVELNDTVFFDVYEDFSQYEGRQFYNGERLDYNALVYNETTNTSDVERRTWAGIVAMSPASVYVESDFIVSFVGVPDLDGDKFSWSDFSLGELWSSIKSNNVALGLVVVASIMGIVSFVVNILDWRADKK